MRRWYSGLNLQNRLFFSYVCLIAAGLFLFGVISYRVAADSVLDLAKKNVSDLTVKNLEQVETRLNTIEERVEWVSREQEVEESLREVSHAGESALLSLDRRVNAVLSRYFYEEEIVSACIVAPGYTLGNNAQVRVPNAQFYESEIYRRIISQKERGVWIPSYFAKEEYQTGWEILKPLVFMYAYRLDFSGQPDTKDGRETILLVHLNTDLFRNFFGETGMGEDAFYCISDQAGKIIAHTDPKKEGMNEPLPWLAKCKTDSRGSMVVDYQGQEAVVCYAASSKIGWIAATVAPVPRLLEGVSTIRYFICGIGGILFAAALGMAMLLAGRITRPIGQLEAAMKKVGEGDFGVRLSVTGSDEIQYLIEKYNEMGEQIETLIEKNYKSEIRNRESEIMALNLQLNPHFLYNTLNVINLMALEEGEMEISRMVISLSDMMQYTFRNKNEMVRFEEELQWLKNYIFIMQNRFEGKFEVVYEIAPGMDENQVPKLLLQPMVENAVLHGFRNMNSGGLLEISCREEGELLRLTVRDNGQGIEEERLQASLDGSAGRTGLVNAKKRLELLYGGRAKLSVWTEPGKGCAVNIVLPRRQRQM